jgi:sugar O-acyltransferase (sialic acid O-acetyltransferase NeuD family)
MTTRKPIIIIGNGGHAKVLTEILKEQNYYILGFTSPKEEPNLFGLPYLGDDHFIFSFSTTEVDLVNAIGSTESMAPRMKIYDNFSEKGYRFINIIHSSVIVSPSCKLGEGVQLMAGSVIQPFAKIDDNTIINTSVTIDHDCEIGKHCHIAPGTTLSGTVLVGDSTHIGTGTVIIQNVKIGSNVLIGAGSLVLKDIQSNRKVFGVPAKEV